MYDMISKKQKPEEIFILSYTFRKYTAPKAKGSWTHVSTVRNSGWMGAGSDNATLAFCSQFS